MSLFNSLGSNYSPGFIWQSLFTVGSNSKTGHIKELIASTYNVPSDHVTLTYKARHAIELALRLADLPPQSKVAINGFTCFVVYEAVQKAGHQPVFIDVAEGSLDFDE